jgi:hypothetical protein
MGADVKQRKGARFETARIFWPQLAEFPPGHQFAAPIDAVRGCIAEIVRCRISARLSVGVSLLRQLSRIARLVAHQTVLNSQPS